MTRIAQVRLVLAAVVLLASLWCLETARKGLTISTSMVGGTPLTSVEAPGGDGPVVVVAHGFAGSSQMMQGFAFPLAQAGYRVHMFDFLGHGRNDVPMSGDVSSVDGTTRLLVDQTSRVIDTVRQDDADIALIGHSMASDVLARVAAEREDIGPVVLISAFSQVIDRQTPENLLLVTGAWEPGLRGFATDALRMVNPDANEGEVVTTGDVRRGALVAPRTEHVSVLHSPFARKATVDWLDSAYGRRSDGAILPTGPAIVGLLAALVLLFAGAARAIPKNEVSRAKLTPVQISALLVVPICAAPLVSWVLEPRFLPVLVADYLAVHLAVYGCVQLILLRAFRVSWGRVSGPGLALMVLASAIIIFALNRYAANFVPSPQRLWIVAVMLLGAFPFFIADARLCHRVPVGLRLLVHGAFLVSIGLAVALDFEGLFFLLMIAPVVVFFYLVFGSLGHAVSTRCGPLAPGIVLGLVLAVALGVSFPLFSA